ncbi:SMAD/FHA domain-containing protein [Sistotremastrum niveocremeum HHB9708]|uniref:SMAD/FHA domain-containing protein n=1 Tax=Sistotremastrum niveocremeum HHB9708 TaxID=1314777 RepID=A0A164UPL4_9AGAM|nr:SMAD/FHA domain-containing protein [Sistotremastrum niveocremeum HHB9708]
MPRSRSRSPRSSRSNQRYSEDRSRAPKEYSQRDRRRSPHESYPRERRRSRSRERYDRSRRDDEDRELSARRHREDPVRREKDDDAARHGGRDSRQRSLSEARGSRSPSVSDLTKKPNLEPNFKPSGLLVAATNTVKHGDGSSTLLKYNEPPEARKPTQDWRLFVFKGSEDLGSLHISQQSAYLLGRDRLVVEIPLEHPSCSKQHAAIQFRSVTRKDDYGNPKSVVKPFIIDLESTNGTHVNGEEIPSSRYFELKHKDVLKFGLSEREYVVIASE